MLGLSSGFLFFVFSFKIHLKPKTTLCRVLSVSLPLSSIFNLGRASVFCRKRECADWRPPRPSSPSRAVRWMLRRSSSPDMTPYSLCFCFSLFRSASLLCSATAIKNKNPFQGEMTVRNGFEKKRLMRRADSTYITM